MRKETAGADTCLKVMYWYNAPKIRIDNGNPDFIYINIFFEIAVVFFVEK